MNRKHGLGNKKWERRTKTHRLEGTRKNLGPSNTNQGLGEKNQENGY